MHVIPRGGPLDDPHGSNRLAPIAFKPKARNNLSLNEPRSCAEESKNGSQGIPRSTQR
jgi:hypothetical protein